MNKLEDAIKRAETALEAHKEAVESLKTLLDDKF